VLVSNLQENSS